MNFFDVWVVTGIYMVTIEMHMRDATLFLNTIHIVLNHIG